MENKEFKKYLKEAREEFNKEVSRYNVYDNLQLKTACDGFLIAFDQATEKAINYTQKIMDDAVLAADRHSFFESLGFYKCSPNPLFRLDLPTTDTYLLADKYGFLWLEYDEEHGVGFGKFTDEQIKTLVSTMLNRTELPTSTQLLSDCKKRFKELEETYQTGIKGNFDYRSYRNGYLDSFSKNVVGKKI